MTLMEILVALSLLLIIIVGTTPVMLQAYDGLYTAGEYTQNVYEAKSEIEDQLAQGIGFGSLKGYGVNFGIKDISGNFTDLGQVATINGKRAVSSLYTSLETVFTNSKAYVAIVSSKVINDDKLVKTVILQTTNIGFEYSNEDDGAGGKKTTTTIGVNKPEDVNNKVKDIDITAIIPDKSKISSQEETKIYAGDDNHKAVVEVVKADPVTGRITIEISDAKAGRVDFTNSPVKIVVTYRDENDKTRKVSCYLTIKTPTILMAGETTSKVDYYTSAGVETVFVDGGDNEDTQTVKSTSLQVDPRVMSIDEFSADYTYTFNYKLEGAGAFGRDKSATATIKIDSGASAIQKEQASFATTSDETVINKTTTNFKSINWIYNDTTTANVEPYYVMTGSNGAIYRTYSFTGSNSDLMTTVGIDTASQPGYSLANKQQTKVYQSLWGGDKAHQFGYSTHHKSMGYSNGDWSWMTEDGSNYGKGAPSANAYSTKAHYAYYYNGYGMTYDYDAQASRRISYILTEFGHSMRIGGIMGSLSAYNENYNRIWEQILPNEKDGGDDKSYFWKEKGDEFSTTPPIYYVGGAGKDTNNDFNFTQIRLKYLTTLYPEYMFKNERPEEDTQASSVSWLNSTNDHANVIVTDAVYIPPSGKAGDTTTGKMFYIGTVAAYAMVNQTDNAYSGDNWAQKNDIDDDKFGARSGYAIISDPIGTTTSVYKHSKTMSVTGHDGDAIHNFKVDVKGPLDPNTTSYSTSDYYAKEFFVSRPVGVTKSILFNDLLFTMGFTSNREMVYSQIVYDGTNEAYKSYEPLYFTSNYGTSARQPNLYMSKVNGNLQAVSGYAYDNYKNYFNSPDNDYYNVWFPGEMYNLTKTATKDNVTVAVGYTVAASTYQYMEPGHQSNTSTAMGGIYNDGVLACMIGGQDTSMKNLLYFKDNDTFDSTSLSTQAQDKTYKGIKDLYAADRYYDYANPSGTAFNYDGNADATNNGKADYTWLKSKGYGTHTRQSIQFTAVDIAVLHNFDSSTNKEHAEYYAVYADNTGRLFASKVADKWSTIKDPENYDPENPGDGVSDVSLNKVDYILSATHSASANTANTNFSTMLELKVQVNDEEKSLSNYFDKITTIRCDGNTVLVGGYSKGDWTLVVGVLDPGVAFYKVEIADTTANGVKFSEDNAVEDILLLGGYAYFVGKNTADNTGWVYAHSLDDIVRIAQATTKPGASDALTFNSNHFKKLEKPVYAIAGHESD